jgi:hypothetical protein
LYGKECSGEGFPFALPQIKLFDRCAAALGSLSALSEKNCFHAQAIKFAERLRRILESPIADLEIQKTVQDLKAMNSVFTELREILRLEKTDVYKHMKDKKIPDEFEVIAKLEEEVSSFRGIISGRLETDAGSDADASAICVILDYLDKYERYLFNHFYTSYDASGNIIVKLIERTNNIMEKSYRDQKHQMRRRTGIKNLGFVFEHLFPASAMMPNLENPIYQLTVLNNKSRGGLTELFSSLDNNMDYRDTPMFQDDSELIGGRLPKADKKIVGKSEFTEVIYMLTAGYCFSY